MNAKDQNHRALLQRIAHRAMLERGLLPDFSTEALAELGRLSVPKVTEDGPAEGPPGIRDMRNLLCADVRGGMIGEIGAVVIRVTVKPRSLQSGPWKTDDITIAILICHIHYDNFTVGRTLFVPTMESDDLGLMVDRIDMDTLPAQPLRHS